ncbi:MAG: lipopolysaccharide core heptose(I) kinase RfaP [Isosphaeraceae bacterium]
MSDGLGNLWERLVRGSRWTWLAEDYRAALPVDLADTVMTIESHDRYHAKQGRSTARVVFHGPEGPLPVYLKRHDRLPWLARLAALVDPGGRHTPGGAEFAHLARARSLGLRVPEVVAAGERIGPWGKLQSFLIVAELTGSLPMNEAIPWLKERLDCGAFERLKRGLAREMAEAAAMLHRARIFHKDLYLCHFFLNLARADEPGNRLALIDLHRLAEHRWWVTRWRRKDLGQLLFSTEGVAGITGRDRLRFWVHYRALAGLSRPRWEAWMVARKSARYLRHNNR